MLPKVALALLSTAGAAGRGSGEVRGRGSTPLPELR